MSDSGAGAAIALYSDCQGSSETVCDRSGLDGASSSSVQATLTAGEEVVIGIEGSEGAHIGCCLGALTELNCGDLGDDDLDGDIDCDDSDCVSDLFGRDPDRC